MSTRQFIHNAAAHGIKLAVVNGSLTYDAPEGAVTPKVLAYLRDHKREIIAAMTPPPLAVLLQTPDGKKFWLAPDGFHFNHGGTPILRQSIMDALNAGGGDVAGEIRRLIDVAHEMGGELSMGVGNHKTKRGETMTENKAASTAPPRRVTH